MRSILTWFLVVLIVPGAVCSQDAGPEPVLPESFHWVAPPNIPGLQAAWVLGSEAAQAPYLLRVRLAAGGRIPPHAHPDTRNSTVLSGTLYVGFGEQFDEDKMVAVPAGGVYLAPAGVMHYLWAKEGEIAYQESGVGPTATVMVLADKTPEPGPDPESESPLAVLSWLSGCWAAESGEAGSGEYWSPVAGGAMLGVGRTVKNGQFTGFEYMRVQTNSEGIITFTAHPSGQEEASFELISLSPIEVIFENLQHDFPQRIAYRKLSEKQILGHIEGRSGEQLQGMDFPLSRIPCEVPVDR